MFPRKLEFRLEGAQFLSHPFDNWQPSIFDNCQPSTQPIISTIASLGNHQYRWGNRPAAAVETPRACEFYFTHTELTFQAGLAIEGELIFKIWVVAVEKKYNKL
jgi:hypothetical protein